MIRRWTKAAIALAILAVPAAAQQATIGVPFNTGGSSFFENIGVGWGLRGNGWFANFPGPGPAPPFGGFDPNAGAHFGIAGPNGFLNFAAGQGANTTLTNQTPFVTVMNGATGFFSDTVQRPFVTGLIPVVGNMPTANLYGPPPPDGASVLGERLERLQAAGGPAAVNPPAPPPAPAPVAGSTADRGDLSVAEIKARQAAEKSAGQDELAALLAKAGEAEAAGKTSVAKLYLQMAARRATGEQKQSLLERVQRLGDK